MKLLWNLGTKRKPQQREKGREEQDMAALAGLKIARASGLIPSVQGSVYPFPGIETVLKQHLFYKGYAIGRV